MNPRPGTPLPLVRSAPANKVGGDRPRTTTRLAWFLWAVGIVLFAVSWALRVWNAGRSPAAALGGAASLANVLYWIVLIPATVPAYSTVGAVVASRRPRNAVGWSCLALGLLTALEDISWQYLARTYYVTPGSLPAGSLVAWSRRRCSRRTSPSGCGRLQVIQREIGCRLVVLTTGPT